MHDVGLLYAEDLGVVFADLEWEVLEEVLEEVLLEDRLEGADDLGLDLAFTSVIDLMMGLMELEGDFVTIWGNFCME